MAKDVDKRRILPTKDDMHLVLDFLSKIKKMLADIDFGQLKSRHMKLPGHNYAKVSKKCKSKLLQRRGQ